MEKEKIKAINDWQTPRNVKQIQAFLGFANFYWRFINQFSSIAKPLTSLTQKKKKWEWGEEQQKAFDLIKQEISKDPVLVHPNPEKLYFLETDASGVAMGAILSQRQDNGYLHPIAFLSKSFNAVQMNYDTHDKELFAIITALIHWCLFLEGTKEPITIFTDHHNLERWKTTQIWNGQQARWHQLLASFNFHIEDRARKLSNKPDALSRWSDHKDIPKAEQIMITSEHFWGFAADTKGDIISEIQEAQGDNEGMETLISSTRNKENLPLTIRKQYDQYKWEGGPLWYDNKIIIPANKGIQQKILEQHHDHPIAGHQGQARTLELIS